MAERISNFLRPPRVVVNEHATEDCLHHGKVPHREVEQFDGSFLKTSCQGCRWDSLHQAPKDSNRYKQALSEKTAATFNTMLIASGITPRFRDCTFGNFNANGDPAKAKALATCEAYVDQFAENYVEGRSLILSGNVGTGKTHLASAMVQGVIRRHVAQALIVPIAEIVRVAKGTMAKGAAYDERDVIQELADVDLLVIDEVGAQRGSEYEQSLLHEVIDRRYQLVLPTVLVSNLRVEDLKGYIGDRALDRLRQGGGKAIGFTWASARGDA